VVLGPLLLILPDMADTIYADSQDGATALLHDTVTALAEICIL